MMPAPGRPKFPSRSCNSAQQPMICGPFVCCVHATAYANDVVRSAPELARMVSATLRKMSCGQPVVRSTISGVYRPKCFLTIWKTQRGFSRVSSLCAGGFSSDLIRPSYGGPEGASALAVAAAAAFVLAYCQLLELYSPRNPL